MTPYTDEDLVEAEIKLRAVLKHGNPDWKTTAVLTQCALTRAQAEAMKRAAIAGVWEYRAKVAETELERLRKRESEACRLISIAGFPVRNANAWVDEAGKWLSETATEVQP